MPCTCGSVARKPLAWRLTSDKAQIGIWSDGTLTDANGKQLTARKLGPTSRAFIFENSEAYAFSEIAKLVDRAIRASVA